MKIFGLNERKCENFFFINRSKQGIPVVGGAYRKYIFSHAKINVKTGGLSAKIIPQTWWKTDFKTAEYEMNFRNVNNDKSFTNYCCGMVCLLHFYDRQRLQLFMKE